MVHSVVFARWNCFASHKPLEFQELNTMANLPWPAPRIARSMKRSLRVTDFEFFNIDLVFTYELPKRASLFLRCLRCFRNVASVSNKKILDIVCLKPGDHICLHLLKGELAQIVVLTREPDVTFLNSLLSAKHHDSLNHMFQFSNVAGPAIKHQLALCFRREIRRRTIQPGGIHSKKMTSQQKYVR